MLYKSKKSITMNNALISQVFSIKLLAPGTTMILVERVKISTCILKLPLFLSAFSEESLT